ncbi:MAG: extracellular solute-binding protein [Candidatus Pacebacteria bacterium]|nr:extracellular solute-binding protein [Candidatus Paceibacterota bacterium]
MIYKLFRAALMAGFTTMAAGAFAAEPAARHGMSLYGELKYPTGFKNFDYANPNAPKGGTVRLAAVGTFDSLNPFILKGVAADKIGLVFDSLAVSADDEPFSKYGLIAETMQMPADRSWVQFNLRKSARFFDGSPITAEDVAFSFELLKTKGNPLYRFYYADVAKVEVLSVNSVRFIFSTKNNRELPLIVAGLPVLSKKWYSKHNFEEVNLVPPLGSGPYSVESVNQGKSIVYKRNPDYWARDLAVVRGQYNFDRIQIDYYRDDGVALESLKANNFDLKIEPSAKNWATAYEFPAVKEGKFVKKELVRKLPEPMQAYIFNMRRPIFADLRVRQALAYGFDFEWSNRALFYNAYKRTTSYFMNSSLQSQPLPSKDEVKILNRYRDRLPPELFTTEFKLPVYDGSGNIREGLIKAVALLKEAGWEIKDGKLTNSKGQVFQFEILNENPLFERITLPFIENLKRLGITAKIKTIDETQHKNRLNSFDYDMIIGIYPQSNSPGNEQREYWGSKAADTNGSRNYSGLKNQVVDQLVEDLIQAQSRKELETVTQALDRVLLSQHMVIPHFNKNSYRVGHWDIFGYPQILPNQGFDLNLWWIDPIKYSKNRS